MFRVSVDFSCTVWLWQSLWCGQTINNAIVPSLLHGTANNQVAIRAQEMKTSRVLFAAVFGFCTFWIPSIAFKILDLGFKISIPVAAQSIPVLFASISAWINLIMYDVLNRAVWKDFQLKHTVLSERRLENTFGKYVTGLFETVARNNCKKSMSLSVAAKLQNSCLFVDNFDNKTHSYQVGIRHIYNQLLQVKVFCRMSIDLNHMQKCASNLAISTLS